MVVPAFEKGTRTPVLWLIAGLLTIASYGGFAQSVETSQDPTSRESKGVETEIVQELQRISLAAKSPEDLIRQKEALIDTLPVTPAPTEPDAASYRADWRARVLAEGSEEARLRVEIIDTVEDLRSQASGPEESIRLIDEFRDLNRETLEGLRKASKPPRDAAPSPTVPLDRPSEENRLRLDILSALSEIEGHAKSPEELIHLKAEFLRLNKETLQELLSDSIDSNKKGQ